MPTEISKTGKCKIKERSVHIQHNTIYILYFEPLLQNIQVLLSKNVDLYDWMKLIYSFLWFFSFRNQSKPSHLNQVEAALLNIGHYVMNQQHYSTQLT